MGIPLKAGRDLDRDSDNAPIVESRTTLVRQYFKNDPPSESAGPAIERSIDND
jgi:hypothetical protein